MKMIDLGRKEENTIAEQTDKPSEKKPRICYPGFSMYENVPDVLFNKDVGDTITATVVMKMTSKGMDENGERKSRRVSYDVLKIGIDKGESDLEKEILRQTGSGEKEDE